MSIGILKKISGAIFSILLMQLITAVPATSEDLPLLTLEECIEKGLNNDPSLVQSKATLDRAGNSMWTSYGSFLPSIRVSSDYNYRSNPFPGYYVDVQVAPDSFATVPIYVNDSWGQSLTLSQNLFNGFSDYFSLKSNKANKEAAKMSYSNQVLSTVYNIKVNYFAVLRAMKLTDVQRKALERSEEQLRITETRYELGSAALSDVLKARVSHGEAQLNLISAENSFKVSSAQLNYAVGEDISRRYRVDSTVTKRNVHYTLEGSVDFALKNNPKLHAYQKSIVSSKHSVRSAWGGFLPSLEASYSASWFNAEEFDLGTFFNENHTYRYGLTLSLNIFDQFITKRQISDAKASYNTDRFNYHNYRNGLQLEVTEAYLEYEKAQLSLEVANDKLASAREDYKLANEKYSLGAATILDLLDAEVSLKTAERDVIESEFDLNLAVASLEKAMGVDPF